MAFGNAPIAQNFLNKKSWNFNGDVEKMGVRFCSHRIGGWGCLLIKTDEDFLMKVVIRERSSLSENVDAEIKYIEG